MRVARDAVDEDSSRSRQRECRDPLKLWLDDNFDVRCRRETVAVGALHARDVDARFGERV